MGRPVRGAHVEERPVAGEGLGLAVGVEHLSQRRGARALGRGEAPFLGRKLGRRMGQGQKAGVGGPAGYLVLIRPSTAGAISPLAAMWFITVVAKSVAPEASSSTFAFLSAA